MCTHVMPYRLGRFFDVDGALNSYFMIIMIMITIFI